MGLRPFKVQGRYLAFSGLGAGAAGGAGRCLLVGGRV